MDEVLKFQAEMDQIATAMANIAGLTGAYFAALLKQGFTREEAMALVELWQAEFFAGVFRKKPE